MNTLLYFLKREKIFKMVKYLYLENTKIDEMIFDIPCGSRNNIEEINSLYNYNIPGYKNNNLRISCL